ncbi:MAG: hypothetical protein NTV22_01050, partial [bacterium]|nr:hypothetical protein [bacterium]
DIDTSYVTFAANYLLRWDELRIGDTWQDAMPRTIFVGSPDIALYEDGSLLPTGGATDYGTLSGSMTAQKTITITNLGDAALFLTASNTPIIEIAGGGAGYFSVTAEPATNIPAGAATTFVLQFDPPNTGDGSAAPLLIIANNDPDEDPYVITLNGAWNNSFYAYEPFDYETNTALNTQNGGIGWNSAWNSSGYTVEPDSLPFDLLVVNGNHAERNGTFFPTVRALAPTFGTPGQTVWVSYVTAPLSNSYDLITDANINPYVFYALSLQLGAQTKLSSGKRSGQLYQQMDSQGTYGSTTIAVTSTPAFIVHRLIYGTPTNQIAMWVNPLPGDAEPGAPDQTITTTSNMQFNTVGLFASGGIGPSNMYGFYFQDWDEIRVGLTWQQVAPFVPEPVLLLPLLLCSLKLKSFRF